MGVPPAVLAELRAAAAAAGVRRLAIVGGAVRDGLLHQHYGWSLSGKTDWDWVVEGDVLRLAVELSQRCGVKRVTELQEYETFGTVALRLDGLPLDLAMARRETYLMPGQNPTVKPGSLESDLVRRDFTINAMAQDLISGNLIDPYHGQRDLAAGRLVFLSDRSVSDDPTRVVRAARYAARLGFVLAPEARQQVIDTVRRWPWSWHWYDTPEYAPPTLASRMRMELDRLLEKEPWREALDLLEDWQAMSLLDPVLQGDLDRARRLRWAQRLKIPLLPAWLAAASIPEAVARRLCCPGQQQQWLRQLKLLKEWLSSGGAPSVDASPAVWTAALEDQNWMPETVALMVCLKPRQWKPLLRWWGRWRRLRAPKTAQDLMAAGWLSGPGLGTELRRLRLELLGRSR
ncbi:CCA tRNA nucleotidyltransferase [Synechococcus sp. M16CYN]|uniref:CCA tRNA nucleotidyltransferase n=1 Tax=Synechococcus sp. M16CYN TaxID=3103139 RepID=UPI0032486B1A